MAAFTLFISGSGVRAARTLSVRRGSAAAAVLLLLAASAFAFPLGKTVLGGGVALLLLMMLRLEYQSKNAAAALIAAGFSGMLAFLLHTALPGVSESAFLPGATAALAAAVILPRGRDQAFSAAASPLFYAGCLYLEEYCLFETAIFHMDGAVFNAEVLALGLLCCWWSLGPELPKLLPRLQERGGSNKKWA